MMRHRWTICLSLAIASLAFAPACASDDGSKPVSDFELRDFRGKLHKLSDYTDANFVVLAFWGTECPLAKLYALRLPSAML